MKRLIGFAMLSALFAVAACRTAPIDDVHSAPLKAPAGVTLDEVQKGIVRAGKVTAWQMTEIAPGHLEAKVNVRGKHQALVDIKFDTEAFSIRYRDSVNLNYDEARAMIHPNYNEWIHSLEAQIQNEMESIAAAGVAERSPAEQAKPVATSAEAAAWRNIRNSRNSDDYRAFLAAYPDGEFADLARKRAAVPDNQLWSSAFAGPVPANEKRRVEAFFSGQARTAIVALERYNTKNNIFAPNQAGQDIAVIEDVDVLAADPESAVVKVTYVVGSRIWGTLDSHIYEMEWQGSDLTPRRHQRP
ncbi:MAG: hypothetical protein QNJ67_22140 [Kiloniellales bacterium]|nr:hypothetical protein [Kiloniellales bacterium]